MNAVPRAVIYARCSAVRQAEKELSIPAQIDACRAEARRRGWEVVAEYVDEAESARTADRPRFQDMIGAAREKPRPFEHILVWKFSRFSRSREDSVLYKAMLERAGVKLISLNEPIDDSPAGRMLEGMLEVLDEFYSANLAEDTVRGMRKNASLGYYNGGATAVGYRKRRTGTEASPKNVLEIDPAWAPLVRRMFRMVLEGKGARSIAAELDGEGALTPLENRWNTQTVLHVLRNEVYTGTYTWGRVRTGRQAHKTADPIRKEDCYPALVSREDFDAVQALLAQRARKRINPTRLHSNYLLSGLLWCTHCASPFIGHPAKSGAVHYYGCQRKLKTGAKACEAKLLNQQQAEDAVVSELIRSVLTPENLTELVRCVNEELSAVSTRATDELVGVQEQLKEARKRLERLYAALEEGTLELEDLAPRIRDLKARVDGLNEREREVSERAGGTLVHLVSPEVIRGYVEGLHGLLLNGTIEARKAFVRSWIRRIDATGYDLEITYALPPMPRGGEPMRKAANGELWDRNPDPQDSTSGGGERCLPPVLSPIIDGSRCVT